MALKAARKCYKQKARTAARILMRQLMSVLVRLSAQFTSYVQPEYTETLCQDRCSARGRDTRESGTAKQVCWRKQGTVGAVYVSRRGARARCDNCEIGTQSIVDNSALSWLFSFAFFQQCTIRKCNLAMCTQCNWSAVNEDQYR